MHIKHCTVILHEGPVGPAIDLLLSMPLGETAQEIDTDKK